MPSISPYNSTLASPSSSTDYFSSSPPFRQMPQQEPQLPYPKYAEHHEDSTGNCPQHKQDILSSALSPLVTSEGFDAALLSACNFMEIGQEGEEDEGFEGGSVDMAPEIAANKAFIEEEFLPGEEFSDDDVSINSDTETPPRCFSSSPDSYTSGYAKEKLIRILSGQVVIPQQHWGLDKILMTLVYHRKDKRLQTPFRQFKKFAYETMLVESRSSGPWSSALLRKDWDNIIDLGAQSELEKRYAHEVQSLCKTPSFGLVDYTAIPRDLDKAPLEEIVSVATTTAPLLTSLVACAGPARKNARSHLNRMKLVAILVILCRTAHRNNSNYLPSMIALYLYSAGA